MYVAELSVELLVAATNNVDIYRLYNIHSLFYVTSAGTDAVYIQVHITCRCEYELKPNSYLNIYKYVHTNYIYTKTIRMKNQNRL